MVDSIPKETLLELKETFGFFERNPGDGVIPNKSLGTALRVMGLNPSEATLKAICDETDEDGSGNIRLNTFLLVAYALQLKHADSEQEIREAFKVYAKDSPQASPYHANINNASIVSGGGGNPLGASSSRPASPSMGPDFNGSFIPNTSFMFSGRVGIQAPPPMAMSVDDLRRALMETGEPFSEDELDELLRELDLMPGDDVSIDDLLRIVALEGVERNEAASAGRRRARTMIRVGGGVHGGGGGGTTSGSPTTRPSRTVSVAPENSGVMSPL